MKTCRGQYEVDLSIELSDQLKQTLYAWKDEKIQLVKCSVYDEVETFKIMIGYSKTIDGDDIKDEKEFFTIKRIILCGFPTRKTLRLVYHWMMIIYRMILSSYKHAQMKSNHY